ncbi:hypothetical protein SAMN04488564_110351 [Lentzea waywayandensis]|uniref:Uncharacterized protein n=1 Tax=Lentzea waywayandensis TaxID=84724 RepID=A0A1I6FB26_9PSEU|nr:hypothetical protein [Lentzea waywayandensis]SFR27154.1 hypothetical protein SAMN04488564_110351 [Lentzea waywayandensis]
MLERAEPVAVAELGALTREAADLVRDATGASVQRYEFAALPSPLDWQSQTYATALGW